MKNKSIGARLLSAAGLVRRGACFADIGTDHAYLPIFLLENGIIDSAVCTDINEGPLSSARANAREHSVFDSFEFILADGASCLLGKGITDVAICGMGGELISDIIAGADFFRSSEIRLILQPMSKQSELRRYLAESGFRVLKEVYSSEGGKYYLTLLSEFDGLKRELSELSLEFGEELTADSMTPEKLGYFKVRINALARAAEGKFRGGSESSREAELLRELYKHIDKNIFL